MLRVSKSNWTIEGWHGSGAGPKWLGLSLGQRAQLTLFLFLFFSSLSGFFLPDLSFLSLPSCFFLFNRDRGTRELRPAELIGGGAVAALGAIDGGSGLKTSTGLSVNRGWAQQLGKGSRWSVLSGL